jgi:hypothetical protein
MRRECIPAQSLQGDRGVFEIMNATEGAWDALLRELGHKMRIGACLFLAIWCTLV